MDKIQQQMNALSKRIDKISGSNIQYQVKNIPFHVHNGSDSNQISANNVIFTNFMMWGQTASGSNFIITNPNITPTSTILITPQIPSSTYASSVNGAATLQCTSSTILNYLIIF